jgi:hypothetical protein
MNWFILPVDRRNNWYEVLKELDAKLELQDKDIQKNSPPGFDSVGVQIFRGEEEVFAASIWHTKSSQYRIYLINRPTNTKDQLAQDVYAQLSRQGWTPL